MQASSFSAMFMRSFTVRQRHMGGGRVVLVDVDVLVEVDEVDVRL